MKSGIAMKAKLLMKSGIALMKAKLLMTGGIAMMKESFGEGQYDDYKI